MLKNIFLLTPFRPEQVHQAKWKILKDQRLHSSVVSRVSTLDPIQTWSLLREAQTCQSPTRSCKSCQYDHMLMICRLRLLFLAEEARFGRVRFFCAASSIGAVQCGSNRSGGCWNCCCTRHECGGQCWRDPNDPTVLLLCPCGQSEF